MIGDVAEKKEVDKIAQSMKEAKGTKANEVVELLAKFVSIQNLNALLYPLQQAVLKCSSLKTVRKLEVRPLSVFSLLSHFSIFSSFLSLAVSISPGFLFSCPPSFVSPTISVFPFPI